MYYIDKWSLIDDSTGCSTTQYIVDYHEKNGRMSKNIKPKYPFWWSNMSGSVSTIQPEPAVAYFPRTSGIIHWEWGVTGNGRSLTTWESHGICR